MSYGRLGYTRAMGRPNPTRRRALRKQGYSSVSSFTYFTNPLLSMYFNLNGSKVDTSLDSPAYIKYVKELISRVSGVDEVVLMGKTVDIYASRLQMNIRDFAVELSSILKKHFPTLSKSYKFSIHQV